MKLKQYSKYKDSGIQWSRGIPANWSVYKIKFLLKTPVTDGPHETPEFIDEGIPFLLNTIRIPKNLHYLTDRLPKPNY